ncbi:hypothetical protein CR919_08530 [Stenotrophomonas sp. LMG 10879]|uniref:hypothetical protein n=1 Tax=Stenotrophomonas sp. LMG 10879 TaxID=487706 RepID=UPI000C1A6AC7|nr:hypothetical protein [Stenotrophomonas sp. LMG 10879]PII20550.1 hypothetical protein CR919_08530 [Stenotrophomonas sp. LMG 10879]HED4877174.1 hypothetical protein [Stenotrophomonas maltophilia]
MTSFATRCLALACLATPAFAATPPAVEQARAQLVEAVTCQRHLTPRQFETIAQLLAPPPLRAENGESSGEFLLTTPLMVLGQPVNRLQAYDGDSGEDGVDSFTAYFSTASVEQIAALAKLSDPVAGSYTREVGRHNLDVRRFDGQTTISCSYDLR